MAESTIAPEKKFAWSANTGWFNWRPGPAEGVVTGEYVLSGYAWAANVGWIHFGSGQPENGIRYGNKSAADFGVNLLPDFTLRGFAYGANIGWIQFEPTGNPRLHPVTGRLSGKAWSANAGWISLDDSLANYVATTSIPMGADTDADGIADAWELERTGGLTVLTAAGDRDGDGLSDAAEYAADTNPLDPGDALRVTALVVEDRTTWISLTWTSRVTRRYLIEARLDLPLGSWTPSSLGEISADSNSTTTRSFTQPAAAQQFYRIRALRPLAP
jgi:hypothetical protein